MFGMTLYTAIFFKLEFANHFRVCHFTYDNAKEVSLKTVILDQSQDNPLALAIPTGNASTKVKLDGCPLLGKEKERHVTLVNGKYPNK